MSTRDKVKVIGTIETRRDFGAWVEGRSLEAASGTAGGYLLGSEMLEELQVKEREYSVLRRLSRVVTILGDSIGIPTQDYELSDAEWTSELGTITDDSIAPYGELALKTRELAKRIRVSNKLLRHQPFAAEWVEAALAAAIASAQEKRFLKGILQNSSVPVYETAGVGAVQWNEINDWIYSLPDRFQARAQIIMRADFMRHVLNTNSGTGLGSFQGFDGSRLFGKPVNLSGFMPSIVDSSDNLIGGGFAAIVGDFSAHFIADGEGSAVVLRLAELYAANNQTGFQVLQETDAGISNPNAFYLLKIKA